MLHAHGGLDIGGKKIREVTDQYDAQPPAKAPLMSQCESVCAMGESDLSYEGPG
jgi:hypothetical protein